MSDALELAVERRNREILHYRLNLAKEYRDAGDDEHRKQKLVDEWHNLGMFLVSWDDNEWAQLTVPVNIINAQRAVREILEREGITWSLTTKSTN